MNEEKLPPKKKMVLWKKIGIGVLIFILIGQLAKRNNDEPGTEAAQEKSNDDNTNKTSPDSAAKTTKALTSKEIDDLLKGLRIEKDEFQETSFYKDPLSSETSFGNDIYLYLGRSKDFVYPRLKIQYTGDNWLFIEMYHFVIDGQKRSIVPDEKVTRDNGSGKVWEYIDKKPNSVDLQILKEIAESKVAKMRYEGRETVFDREVTKKEKKALGRILSILSKIDSQN